MTPEELLIGMVGKDGAVTFGLVTMLLVDHLHREHGMTREEACIRLGTDEERVDMLRLMMEHALREGQ